jgi:hypothetical protein
VVSELDLSIMVLADAHKLFSIKVMIIWKFLIQVYQFSLWVLKDKWEKRTKNGKIEQKWKLNKIINLIQLKFFWLIFNRVYSQIGYLLYYLNALLP